MPASERVVITIDVNADTAQIEAMRQALRRLAGDMRDLNDENERHRDTSKQVHEENTRTHKDHDRLGKAMRNTGNNSKMLRGRYHGLLKETFALRQDIGKMIAGFGGLIKLINKLSLISLPLMAVGMSGIALLFKSGTGFVKLYRAAMSSLATAFTAAAVAGATFLAAQKQYAGVMNAPRYIEGTATTKDRFVAATEAMSMFTDRTSLAVVGAKSLSAAFNTLSKEKPVTGQTVNAFEGLMNIVAGSGGDISKGAEKLAEFLAKVQKKGLGGASAEAKALGPDFEKIIKEAKELGIKTQEEFFKAAAEGNLGKTFQERYAGQLKALNSTLIGRFKSTLSELKAMIADLGGGFLDPASNAVDKIATILKTTLIRLSPIIAGFGANRFFQGAESFVQKASDLLVKLVTKYTNTFPSFVSEIVRIWDKISGGFEKIQDWARQFVPAGQALIDNFFKPLIDGVIDNFSGGMNFMSDLVLKNGERIRNFADVVVKFLIAMGDYGNMLKRAFVDALPAIQAGIQGATNLLNTFTKIMNKIMDIAGGTQLTRAVAAILVIYTSLTLFSRFFTTFGRMFGKDMNVKANNVYIGGQPVQRNGMPVGGGLWGGGGGGGGGEPIYGPASPRWGTGSKFGMGRMWGRAKGYGVDFVKSPASSMAIMAGGQLLTQYGGDDKYTGQGMNALGNTVTAFGAGRMMGLTTGQSAALAVPIAAYGASKTVTSAIQDLSGGKLGRDDTMGKLGMAAAGAGAGAGVGAAIGFSVGGPAGAAAGALVGTFIGGVVGYMNSGKYQKQARKAGNDLMDNYSNAIEDAFAAGDIKALTKAKDEMLAQHEANLKNVKDQAEYAKVTADLQNKVARYDKQISTYTQNAGLAEQFLNMGTDELNKLAETAGYDVRNKVLSLREMFAMTGRTASQVAGIIKQKWSEISGLGTAGAMGRIQNERTALESSQRINELKDTFLGGGYTREGGLNYIEALLQHNEAKYGTGMGTGAALNTILAQLPQLATVMSPEQIAQLQADAMKALDPSKIIEDIMGNKDAVQNMMTLINQNPLGAKIENADQLRGFLTQGLGADLNFIGRLIAGNETGLKTGNFRAQQDYLEAIFKDSAKSGIVAPSAGSVARGGAGHVNPKQLAPNNYQFTVNVNAKVIDPAVVQEIKNQMDKYARDLAERLGVGPR